MNYTAECITISSDEDEEDVQVLHVLKHSKKIENNEKHFSNNSFGVQSSGIIRKRIVPILLKRREKIATPNESKVTVPVIDLIDDCDEAIDEAITPPVSEAENEPAKLENGYLSENNSCEETKKTEKPSPTSVSNSLDKCDEDGTPESTENLVTKLIEICRKVEYGSEMMVVERKIWNYYHSASTAKTWSSEFKTFLGKSISEIETILNSTKDKVVISRIIKDIISEMKNDPHAITGKLKQLYSVYNKLVRRITKLEEVEVESDEDGENSYVFLDRYRKKAVQVYNKICELEGRACDADRPTLQRFFFASSTAPVPVQRALEKFYNKTRTFPDFCDVKKLVKKVKKDEQLNISESDAHTLAQSVFLEFGERLVWRRKYDDYNILVDYLKEGHCEDPAENDAVLEKKLAENKKKRKKEQEVLDSYVLKEINTKQVENKSKDSSKMNVAECSSSSSKPPRCCKNETKTNLKQSLEPPVTIDVCSSSSSESSSLPSSPVQSDTEDGEETDKDNDENCKQMDIKKIVLFSDSEEELNLDFPDKRKSVEINGAQCNKKFRSDNESSSENDPTKANVNNVIMRVENNL